ncbi:MAG: phosphate signaling complex protein PhoU [Sedimenticolaceae bacterium]|nr:phosphate signaling complex protein PhoU [Sedimenticolaceae bacterium]
MEKELYLSQHISQRFNAELEEIRNRVMKMGGLVEKQISHGMKALLTSDSELGEQVSSTDYEINALEVDIDEECMQILARRQPAASDLRLIMTIIKTITDLERIGDEAEKLGRYSVLLADENTTPGHFVELGHLGEHVKRMLRDALDAFARLDAEAALRTIADDELVNEEFDAISRQLITRMMEDPREIRNALRISWCARALERMGDHTKNICEYVVFLVHGKDIRHTSFEKAQESMGIDLGD